MKQKSRSLAVQPRTRLAWIHRIDGAWLVWTSASNTSGDLSTMLGTAIMLRDDGSACRVTFRADEGDEYLEVMPPEET